MAERNNYKRFLPNLFTFGNMFCGFLSVVMSVEGYYIWAGWLIIFAALCDATDGVMARLTKSSSQFGVELDSIADVISFGFAPAFLIYQIDLKQFGIWGLIISFAFLMAGGFRLARFNAELIGFNKKYFIGLPIPTGAITVSSFIFCCFENGKNITGLRYASVFLVLSVAFLMASRIKYDTIPPFTKALLKEKIWLPILTLIALASVIYTGGKALFIVFSLFIIFGILRNFFTYFSNSNANN